MMKPRFSLRTLFVLTTLIAALFGWRQHRHSRASEFAELLSAGKHRQAEYMTVNPQEFPIMNYVGQGTESIMEAHLDSSSTFSEWWLPSVVVDLRWSRGISGGNDTLKFAQTLGGFTGPQVLSQSRSSMIYDHNPVETTF